MPHVIEKDPRLDRIYHEVRLRTITNTLKALEKSNLVKPIPNDWIPCGQLTEKAFYLISDAITIGLIPIFEHSRINIPSYQTFNESRFAQNLVKENDLPQIRTNLPQNRLEIEFISRLPLIRYIDSYLNTDINRATRIKNIEINKIALIIESPDHLN